MAAGGLFVCACAAALAVVTSPAPGQASKHAPAGVERYTDSEHRAIAGRIELVALGYEREGDLIIVRGVVRNPSSGAELDHVTAVVLLFKEDGGFLTTGRATLQSSALEPGGETTFAVTVPSVNGGGRYRVSFR